MSTLVVGKIVRAAPFSLNALRRGRGRVSTDRGGVLGYRFSREAPRSCRRGSSASYPPTLSTFPTFSTSAEPMLGAAAALERHVAKRRGWAWRRQGGAAANLARGEARPQALLGSCGWDRSGNAGPPFRLRLLRCLRSLRVVSSCILPIPFSCAGLRIGGAARCVGDAEHGYVSYVSYVSYVAAQSGISAAGRSARITRRRRSQLDSARSAKAAPRRGSPSPVGRGSPANRGARAGSTSPRGRPSSKRLALVMPVGCSHVSPRRSGAQVSSDYVCYVAYVRYVSNLSETQRSRQTSAGRRPCGDLAPQLALLPGSARACGDVAAGARFHALRFRYVFYVAHVGYVETIADRSLTGKTAKRMRAAVAFTMPRLRKAMRAVVGKRADESCIRYVFYVLYVGYVVAHRCLAACALGPRGALREAISRRTFPGHDR